VALTVVALVGSFAQRGDSYARAVALDRFAVVARTPDQVRNLDYIAAARRRCLTLASSACARCFPILPSFGGGGNVEMALAILLEAALSFLGPGRAAAAAELGVMIAKAKGIHVLQSVVIMTQGLRCSSGARNQPAG